MAVLKYDVSDVEAGGGGNEPQPALYKGKIVKMTNRKKRADGAAISDLEIVVDLGPDYVRKWTYVKLPDDPEWDKGRHGWKLRELTDALGLPPKGGIDPDKITKQQPAVNVKISSDTDESGDYRGKIKNLFKPGEIEDDEGSSNGVSGTGSDNTTDYSDWTEADLEAEIKERGLDMPSGRKTAEKLIAVLEESDAAGDDSAGETPEPEDDYDDWTEDDLKEEIEKRKIGGNISGRKTKQKMIDALRADDGGPAAEPGTDGDPEPEVTDDYDDWSEEELADEIKVRNESGAEIVISGRKTKEKLIAAMREDDKQAEPF